CRHILESSARPRRTTFNQLPGPSPEDWETVAHHPDRPNQRRGIAPVEQGSRHTNQAFALPPEGLDNSPSTRFQHVPISIERFVGFRL
ncbi:hypothetical protein CORC01_07967, partial [Colletotrichum orchidophilum]